MNEIPSARGLASPGRRGAIAAGGCWLAASAGLALPGQAHAAHAAAPPQRAWRCCRKCQALFFDGATAKGSCAAGGTHEAAGYEFLLPRGAPGDLAAQRDWRCCRKCQSLYCEGLPDRGPCPAGGEHEAAGGAFAPPQGGSETPLAQADWRPCARCHAMFYDGLPDKGRCPAGDGHQPAGGNYVLAHASGYPGKVEHLSRAGAPMRDMLRIMWRDGGRALLAGQVCRTLDGCAVARGLRGHRVQARLGDVLPELRRLGERRFAIELHAPGNTVRFQLSAPLLAGHVQERRGDTSAGSGEAWSLSGAAPPFQVCFGILVNFDMAVRRGRPPVAIALVAARAHSATVHGPQAAHPLAGAVAEYFSGAAFSSRLTRRLNEDTTLRSRLALGVAAALDQVW